jgi:hypothetical protein
MISALYPLVAANVGFAITFGLFVVALLTLFFLTARWAIRHDRAGYAAWRKRQQAAAPPTINPTITPTTTPTTTEATTETVAEGDGPPTSDP